MVEPTEEDVYLSMDMFSYFLVSFMRYPTVANDTIFPTLSYRTESQTFDYFFSSGANGESGDGGWLGWMGSRGGRVRHMLSVDPEVPLLAALRCEGKMGWIRGNPYLVLLEHYLDSFLPNSTSMAVRTPGGDGESGVFDGGVGEGLSRKGELFLRLAIDFWIDTAPVVRYSYDKVSYFKDILSQRSFRSTSTSGPTPQLTSKGAGGAAESAASRLDRMGAGGGGLSSNGNKDVAIHIPEISYDYNALTDPGGAMPSSSQKQLSAASIDNSMRDIPIPTYAAWCTSASATSAVPAGGAVPFTKPPTCTEVVLLSTSLAPVPTKSTLQCVYLMVSHVLTGVSVDHFRQLGPGASSMRWGPGGSDIGGTAATALPLPSPVQLLQQPVFDLLRSLMSRQVRTRVLSTLLHELLSQERKLGPGDIQSHCSHMAIVVNSMGPEVIGTAGH